MRVLMITGAGISASSGLPTYRGENGLYGKLEAAAGMPIEKLLSPQALADAPEKVWEHWRDLSVQIHTSAPTPTHKAMTALSDHYRRDKSENFSPSVHNISHFEAPALLEIADRFNTDSFLELTQNVDGLSRMAGLHRKDIIELHGNYRRRHCTKCKAESAVEIHPKMVIPPKCPACSAPGAFLRPRVVMFGERINPYALSYTEEYARTADLIVVAGTSLQFPYLANVISTAIQNTKNPLLVYVDPYASPYKSTLLALDSDLEIDQKMICIRKTSDEVVPGLCELLVSGSPTRQEVEQWCLDKKIIAVFAKRLSTKSLNTNYY